MTGYLVYDVFTRVPFGGNPLAVVPDATGLPDAALLPVAREFGFSETAFVYPPEAGGTARVRIFTPTQEVPFAGHPLIGTAVALAESGGPAEQLLETGAGPIGCLAEAGRAAFERHAELEVLHHPDPGFVAACLGLPEKAVRTENHAPAIASAGLPFLLAELEGQRQLAKCRPQIEMFRRGQAEFDLAFDFAIYAYTRHEDRIRARMFAPLDDIPEDPATGSAAAALGLFLADLEGRAQAATIEQGVEMGRPSVISMMAEPGSVTISGAAVRVMEGRITPEALASFPAIG